MKVSAFALASVLHLQCFGMMTLFKKDKSQNLPNEMMVGVAHQGTLQTKLNVRATCRNLEKEIKIEELEEARKNLRGERVFYTDEHKLIRDKYLNKDFTKARADELGWVYLPNTFSADGTLAVEPVALSTIDYQLYHAAYQYVSNNEGPLLLKDYQDIKRAFSLASKLGDHDAKKYMMFLHVPNNRYGCKHVFSLGLVRPAIFRKDWQFAEDLIKTNPHGFCSGRHSEVSDHVRCSYHSHDPIGVHPLDKNLRRLTEMAQTQPKYYQKEHQHCTIL